MTTMNISLPDEMKAFVESEMAHEGYASASEYLRALIRDAQKRRAKRDLEAKFREALDSGPATPMTPEDWDSIEREALERLGSKKRRKSAL
jgi:antitoxin ParD1/3/4